MLPLDLHVLSLPLAFILSQDQTLHCIIPVFLILLKRILTSFCNVPSLPYSGRLISIQNKPSATLVPLFSKILIPSRLHSLLPSLHPSFPHHHYLVVWDCKSNTFFIPNQMFPQLFYLQSSNSLVLTEKFFIASSLFFSSNWGFLAIFGGIRCRFAGVLNGVVDIFCQTFFYFRGIITSLLSLL